MYKNVAKYGFFIALAMILSYIEILIPFNLGIPGAKLGLANLVVFLLLYSEGVKSAAIVSFLRILLVGFTFGNLFSIFYSIAGGMLSLGVMALCQKSKLFSKIGVSMAGGVSHNIGQILAAAIVLQTPAVFYYLPFLLIAGLVTGGVIGVLGRQILKSVFTGTGL